MLKVQAGHVQEGRQMFALWIEGYPGNISFFTCKVKVTTPNLYKTSKCQSIHGLRFAGSRMLKNLWSYNHRIYLFNVFEMPVSGYQGAAGFHAASSNPNIVDWDLGAFFDQR